MQKFMADIILQGIDNETRLRLLPEEERIVQTWKENGTLLASYIKAETPGIYMVLLAEDKSNVDKKLSTLPYYPYMKIEIISLR